MVHRAISDRNHFLTGVMLLVAVAIILFTFSRNAEAIPAFARTHQAPCTLCHDGFPKLNHFGEEFERRGFRMPGQEGKFLWEQPLPFAGRINALAQVEINKWSPEQTDLFSSTKSGVGLFDWQILTGGTITPRVSFFGQLVGKVQGLGPDDTDADADHAVHGISEIRTEVFWAQFNDLAGKDGMMNLRIGLDHIDNHFLSTPLRLTHADYLIQFQPGHIGASLHPLAVGVGLNGGLPESGLEYDIGVRNYGPFYDSKEGNEHRLGAFYAVVNKHIAENTVSFLLASDRTGNANLGQDGMTLGYGASLDIHLGKLNIVPGFFWYRDASGTGAGSASGGDDHNHDEETGETTPPPADEHDHDGTEGTTDGGTDHAHGTTFPNGLNVFSGTIGATYRFKPSLLGTIRYDFNNFDVKDEGIEREAKQYVVSLAWYVYPNVRWIAEYSRLTTKNLEFVGEPGLASLEPTAAESDLTQDKVVLRLDVGF